MRSYPHLFLQRGHPTLRELAARFRQTGQLVWLPSSHRGASWQRSGPSFTSSALPGQPSSSHPHNRYTTGLGLDSRPRRQFWGLEIVRAGSEVPICVLRRLRARLNVVHGVLARKWGWALPHTFPQVPTTLEPVSGIPLYSNYYSILIEIRKRSEPVVQGSHSVGRSGGGRVIE